MSIAVSADQILIDIRSWYYRLRMCQAHLEEYHDTLEWNSGLEFVHGVVVDLREACEDAEAFISREIEDLEAEAEAGLGSVRGHQPDGGGEPGC